LTRNAAVAFGINSAFSLRGKNQFERVSEVLTERVKLAFFFELLNPPDEPTFDKGQSITNF